MTFLIKISSKTDVTAYFKRRATGFDGPSATKESPNPETIACAIEHVIRAVNEMVVDEVGKLTAHQTYKNIPKHSYGGWKICLSS